MKTTQSKRHGGFSLIELLVVIAIIAILAALLLPALGRAKLQGQINRAKTEMGNISMAIQAYEAEYNRLPSSAQAITDASNPANPQGDVTFGGPAKVGTAPSQIGTRTNSEVVAILMAVEKFRNGTVTVNNGHARNPKRTAFLRANDVSDNSSAGVGTDGVYRDPWGNPYIISMDLNNDDRTSDWLYYRPAVSTQSGTTGFYGLFNPGNNRFELNGPVMVWSTGPDGAVDTARKANDGVNKDNILNWKP